MYLVDDLSRMRMLTASVYVGIAISSAYVVSIFTEPLKRQFGFSQSDVTTITAVGYCVTYLAFPAGLLYDFIGPTLVLILGGICSFLGFFLYGLTFAGYIPNPTVAVFSVYQAIMHFGLPALDVAALMTVMLQFPVDRGLIVFIQKTFGGLGTAVIMAYFNGWFKSSDSDDVAGNNYTGFSFFIGGQILVCAAVGAYFIRLPEYFPSKWGRKRLSDEEWSERKATSELYMKQRASSRRLMIGVALIVTLLIFSALQSLLTNYLKTPPIVYLIIAIIALLLMTSFTVLALPFQFLGSYIPVRPTHLGTIGEVDESDLKEDEVKRVQSTDSVDDTNKEVVFHVPQYQGSFWRHLLSVPLWCMWMSCFGTWGTGSVMQANAAQFYSAKNYGVVHTSTLVTYIAVMSIGSAVGRMLMGLIDMWLTNLQRTGKTQILITITLPLGPLLFVVAYLLFAVLPQAGLIVPFFLGSVGNGLGWGGTVLASRTMYATDVGKHYNFLFSSAFLASIVLNRFMFGELFDLEARNLGTFPDCNQPSCITKQMWILFGVNVLATIAAFVVHWRFIRFVAAERQKASGAAAQPKPDSEKSVSGDAPRAGARATEPAQSALPSPGEAGAAGPENRN